ncbi:MAG: D-lyxose/D-mannose family sugar isomerase, partial [Oscillospiraceae bacterium]|nr:D-lyxose/D-mannose family sugar isomerase [Oscillospiraceae bacterium]
IVQLYNADDSEAFADTDVTVTIDARTVTIPAGGTVTLCPGQSITLLPRQYHRWIGEKGTGKIMLFEVSTTNDDTIDNRFHSASSRIPVIEEDEAPRFLIFDDYKNYVSL